MDATASLAAVKAFGLGALAERMGIEVIEAHPGRVVMTMPVAGNTQPIGLLHGGASAALAETAGSILSQISAKDGYVVVGIELNCSHHKSARDGIVTAVAEPVSIGRTLAVTSVRITNDAAELVCTARLTCLYRTLPT